MENKKWFHGGIMNVKNAIKERNRALRVLRKHLSQDNLIHYQRMKAMAWKIIKSSKKNAWTVLLNYW